MNPVRSGALAPLTWLIILVAGCGSGEPRYRELETLELPDGRLIIEAARAAEEGGPALLRLRYAGEEGAVLYRSTIANAGAEITVDNVRPDPGKPGYLWLCVNGAEQDDIAVSVNLTTGLIVENPRPCRY